MVVAKSWTKIDPKDAKSLALTTYLSKLEENKTSSVGTVQGGECNRNQTPIKTKVRYHNKSYVEGLKNIESWRFNKSKEKITRYGQYWWW